MLKRRRTNRIPSLCSFATWLLLNVVFFCTIDTSYLGTFFGTKTAPQYTCELFLTSEEELETFGWAFEVRSSYSKSINTEIKLWVAANLSQWKAERPKWFNIEKIPDELLPAEALAAEGGEIRRRRSSAGLR